MRIIDAIKQAKELEIWDAKILMKYVLGVDDNNFIVKLNDEISESNFNKYLNYLQEIKNGKPLQYITHSQHFMGYKFYVDENVLIPQPDTETVVQEALKVIAHSKKDKLKVLDLCTGSGAIAISIKKTFKNKVSVIASDISPKALNVAKKNTANILGSENEILFIESDMFENINEKFDVIVSNPPYIETETIKTLPKDVQNEPILALDGGKDGLDFYRIIRKNIDNYLLSNGFLIMEIGYNQKKSLLKIFDNAMCIKDYHDNDRAIIWNKKRMEKK